MLNNTYRVAKTQELRPGTTVFCYYITPTPEPSSMGVVTSEPDREGWVDVVTNDGRTHNFDASRLAVYKGG